MRLQLSLPNLNFHGTLDLAKFAYNNNVPALLLYDDEGELYMTVSVNLPEHATKLKPNQTFIKNWSENQGILEALQEQNIIGPVLFSVPTGFVEAQAVEILV